MILAFSFGHSTRRFNARAHRERNELLHGHALLADNHETRDDPEPKLRSDEPPPVDALAKERIDQVQHAAQQSGPQNGGNDTAKKNRMARNHRQHCAVKKADEERK